MRALLFSGGLDSVMAWHLLDHPQAIYVKLGHKYQDRELATIERLGISTIVIDGPQVGYLEERDGHIPHRNLLLISTVAALGYDTIYIGALAGEASPDKQPRFYRALERALWASEQGPVKIVAPLQRWTKSEALRRTLLAHPGARDLLLASRSCYGESDEPCGRCQACFRRWVALKLNDLPAGPKPSIPPGSARLLVRAGIRSWPAIARNNLDALRAILRS